MVNKARGEAALEAGERQYRLLLTLGALAEIEDGLGLDDLSQMGARLAHTRAADLAIVAAALLRGGGHEICAAEVLRLPCDLGALTRGITEAFEAAGLSASAGEGRDAVPFPGGAG
ncbi:MAG TPA: GTA-gp10 family protein [Rhizomicrobium sp.]|jgi:hypothetical protein|nr:GTA-gp10 family protein [Rhizomicrobium sp.]